MTWKPIIVGVDASPEAGAAGALGWSLARATGARCRLIHATEDVRYSLAFTATADSAEEMQLALNALLRGRLEAALTGTMPPEALATLTLRPGRPATVLAHEVADAGAELLALGGKHHSVLGRWFGGSTAHNAVRKVDVPVLIAAGTPAPKQRILVAVDLSGAARPTIAAAARLAAAWGARLRALHVLEPFVLLPAAPLSVDPREVDQRTQDALEHEIWPLLPDASVERVVRRGYVTQAIAEEARAWGADLVVMGSHGRGPLERFFIGSSTERMINHLPTSLLVVPVAAAAATEAVSLHAAPAHAS